MSVLGWSLVAVASSPAATPTALGPVTVVVSSLTPASIVANGTSTTTATATATDLLGPLAGETIVFTGPNGSMVSATDQGNGTYTATLVSSKTAGPVTVTATDVAAGASGTATLTQVAGPGANVSVRLAPASIPADGSSTTTATATVTDVNGNFVSGDGVYFFTGDPVSPNPAQDNGNGTYTSTITSSTTPGAVSVVAIDPTANLRSQTTLTQTAGPSTTVLSVVPGQPVTNQTVTMIATVTASLGSPPGTVAFEDAGTPISGCGTVPVAPGGPGNATAACQTSFAAANSPVVLTAVFTPSGGGNPGGSTSAPDLLSAGQDSTSTNLTPSSASPTAGSPVTYAAAVVPVHAGPTQPSGSVEFTDGRHILSGCGSVALLPGNSSSGGSAAATAVCRVSFGAVGPRVITAHYLGDPSFTGSDSPSTQTVVRKRPPPGRLMAMLVWSFTFPYGGTTTTVPMLTASAVPSGASVQVSCNGHGCPYRTRTILISNAKSCKSSSTLRCTKLQSNTVDLTPAFARHRLRVGTRLTVRFLRPGWIGKYYRFTMRAGRRPRQLLACLAPGGSHPGAGC